MVYPAEKFVYDWRRDVAEVNQTSGIDLAQSYKNMTLDGEVEMDANRFNGIEDPDSILGKPSDIFDAAHMKETIAGFKAPEAPAEE